MRDAAALIGMGSNLAQGVRQPEHLLRSALKAMAALPESELLAVSPFYRSPALTMDDQPQPDYCNAVACLRSALSPERLLQQLLEIERQHGRVRAQGTRWQARSLDLDLLVFGNAVINSPSLHLPHPQLGRRSFVLVPMLDLLARYRLPGGAELSAMCRSEKRAELRLWARS